jgi:aspartate racemase
MDPKGQAMKTIGLIGGMSWESSIEYYRIINETVRAKLGGLHSAKSIMYSVDFAEIEALQHQGKWDEATDLMIAAAQRVENGGADFVVICTNTMHRMADEVQKQIKIPLLHIADATAEQIKAQGLKKIGLLGTRFTMEEDFYRGRLTEKQGLEVIIPTERERDIVHRVIFDELCLGEIRQPSKEQYVSIMDHLVRDGAEGIILGCTEISLLIQEEDSQVPLFDTTKIHAVAAVEYALLNH